MTITINGIDAVRELFKQIPEAELRNVKIAINDTARAVQRDIINKATIGRPYLYARTGALWRSVKQKAAVGSQLSEVRGEVYTTSIYAPIQEFGGIVKAKDKFLRVPGGPYLAIPLKANKTPAGVMRFSVRDAFNNLGAVLRKTKSNKWFIGLENFKAKRKKGKTQSVSYEFIPYFVLKKQVKIPPRLHFRRSLDLNMPYFAQRLQDILDGISRT